MKPLLAATATEASDEQLVAAVREGSEEAFEALYRRYRPRIVAYVRSMCSDHARAEDVAQDAFMSALRGLKGSDREIAFRPWLYEIAKNACIDHMRRAGRSTEVSIDSDDFSAQEEGRISQSVAATDAEVARRKALESLQMAFGDLPPSQHEILVMREFEGLSYDRIGSRMGLSRGAVESLLFRARRTLRDGFDEIDTGERCVRMRIAMEAMADNLRTGMRERRRISVHLRGCAECRRTAVAIGLDDLALAAARERGGALRRVAGFLPLPAFLRRRMEDGLSALGSMGPAAEHGASLTGKAAAVVAAAAIAAGGAGVANKASGGAVPLPGGIGAEAKHKSADKSHGDAGGTVGAGGQAGASAGAAAIPSAGANGNAGGLNVGPQGGGHALGPASLPGALGGAGNDTPLGGGPNTDPRQLTGPDGSVVLAPGGTAKGTVQGVSGTVGKVVSGVTGKVQKVTGPKSSAPKGTTPKVRLPDAGKVTGGAVKKRTPAGGGQKVRTPVVPVDPPAVQVAPPTLPAPQVQLPQTSLPLPAPGIRLP